MRPWTSPSPTSTRCCAPRPATSPRASGTTTSPRRRAPAAGPTSCGRRSPTLGFLGGAPPRGVRRWRRRHHRARDRVRGARRAGLPAAADPRVGRDLRRADQPLRHRRRRRDAGCRRSSPARRWCSRSPSPTPVRTATTSRRPRRRDGDVYRLRGTEDLHLRRRRGAARCSSSPAPASTTRPGARKLSLFVVDTDAPGLERTPIPVEIRAPRSSSRCSSTTSRCRPTACSATRAKGCARCSSASTPSASSSASICTGIGRYALDRAAAYAKRARGVGRADRPPPGRRAPAGARPRSRSSSRG